MSLILGIDIGSTSCKASLVRVARTDFSEYYILDTTVSRYDLGKPNFDPRRSEIPVQAILSAVQLSIANLNAAARGRVEAIAFCGQMHGCTLWQGKPWKYDKVTKEFSLPVDGDKPSLSPLYSWQDGRCDSAFLASLPPTVNKLASGYGNATIFWLLRNQKRFLDQFNHTGTIMDLMVAMVCDLDEPCMTPQNAAGFGYFKQKKCLWAEKKLIESGFPVHILPKICKVGTIAGKLSHYWIHMPKNIPVFAAFGDLQCSTFTCIRDTPNMAVINVSTSMQIVVNPANDPGPLHLITRKDSKLEPDPQIIIRIPYVTDKFILVGASLNGGNVLETMVRFIRKLVRDLTDIDIDSERIWFKLVNQDFIPCDESPTSTRFVATLFGERFKPSARAAMKNIGPELTMDKIFSVVCQGLVDNIFTFMPIKWLENLGIREIKGTGSALLRNNVLRAALQRRLAASGISVSYEVDSDAQVGAALMAAMFIFKMMQQKQQQAPTTTINKSSTVK